MTVNSYLETLSSNLILRGEEEAKINVSTMAIGHRIEHHFGNSVTRHFRFGSSTRGTMLPRIADERSDIDYMIVFDTSTNTYKPQTYLNQLKSFVEKYYNSSEIHQSSPTIVLELQHIKFELVPAVAHPYFGLYIPNPGSYGDQWMTTDPNGFNLRLTQANQSYNSQIKPLVRLVKYWNARNSYPFSSYFLENHIIGMAFSSNSRLSDCFISFWLSFPSSVRSSVHQYVSQKLDRAYNSCSQIWQFIRLGDVTSAEHELQKFLPQV